MSVSESPPISWYAGGDDAGIVAILLPAMGVAARHYERFAENLARTGLHVAVSELRGQGAHGPRPSRRVNHGFFELAAEDVAANLDAVSRRCPGASVALVGHSLGGHIAMLYAGVAAAQSISAVVTIAADSPYFRCLGFRGPLVLASAQAAALASRVVGYFPGDLPGLGGLGAQPRTLMAEWAALARFGRYEIDQMPDAMSRIGSATLPVLAISVEGDPIAPQASVDHLASMFHNASPVRWHYTKAVASADKLDHMRWIKHSDALVARVRDWLQQVC